MIRKDDWNETALIASLLTNPRKRFPEVSGIIQEEDLKDKRHRAAYKAVAELYRVRAQYNHEAVLVHCWDEKYITDEDDYLYLTEVIDSVCVSHHAAEYARAIVKTPRTPANKWTQSKNRPGLVSLHEGALAAMQDIQNILDGKTSPVIKTGLRDLDSLIGGLAPGEMITVGGRTGSGKSSLGLSIATNAAMQQDKRVLVFSIEMTAKALSREILAYKANIPSEKIRRGTFKEDDYIEYGKTVHLFRDVPLYFNDDPDLNIHRIREVAEANPADLIIVDYIQLMGDYNSKQRYLDLGKITKELKVTATVLDVPIVGLAQLSRRVELDEEPEVYHIGESSKIEQDSDIVILMHAPVEEREDGTKAPSRNVRTLFVRKMRNLGDRVQCDVAFRGQFKRFENLSKGKQDVSDDDSGRGGK